MSGHEFKSYFSDSGGVDFSDRSTNLDDHALDELRELAARYPQPRSALLPMLHLVQSYDGRVSPAGIEACAKILNITAAQVSGVATFYTMFHRRPAGVHHVGVCTTALCAVMGGDALLERVERKLGIGPDETTPDGKFSLERLECNAACDFAPVMMVNWEYFDNMTPEKAEQLLDELAVGREVSSTRGATITSWKEAERVLAGFPDGRANEGISAGEPSLRGRQVALEQGWEPASPGGGPAAKAGEAAEKPARKPRTRKPRATAAATKKAAEAKEPAAKKPAARKPRTRKPKPEGDDK
jgi:NADH-quinone oxidoreductase subunit E